MIKEKIELLTNNIASESIFDHNHTEDSTLKLFQSIFKELLNDRQPNRLMISTLIGRLEKFGLRSFSYLAFNLFQLFDNFPKEKIQKLDFSILEMEFSDEDHELLKRIMENSLSKNNILQLSNYNVDFLGASNDQKKRILGLLINLNQDIDLNFKITNEKIEEFQLYFTIARQFAIDLDLKYQFYLSLSAYIDRLILSEKYQYCRDFVEEILLSTYIDNCKDAGYYLLFSAYSQQKSAIAAGVYLNLLVHSIEGKPFVYDFIFRGMIGECIKYFRNIKLIPFAIRLYRSIPQNTFSTPYQKLSIDHLYYTLLLYERSPNLPSEVQDYLNKNREIILSFGSNDVLPWLVLLYNIKGNYIEEKEKLNFDPYIKLFESVVPKENYLSYKNLFFGGIKALSDDIKNSLVHLHKTRYRIDFVNDIKNTAVKARVLLEKSFEENETFSFLLSMMIKSDYSLIFKDQASTFKAIQFDKSGENSTFQDLYDHPVQLILKLKIDQNFVIIWLGTNNVDTYYLQFENQTFSKIETLKNFTFSELMKWEALHGNNFTFDNFKKNKNGEIVQLVYEDFEDENRKIKRELQFSSLPFDQKSKYVLIIKDIELSIIPHNLILDKRGEFIYESNPIANILSVEWLSHAIHMKAISQSTITKEIWIPIEGGDFTLNLLYSKIEEDLKNNGIKVHTKVVPENPINSSLNIIAAHGGEDIASLYALHTNDQTSISKIDYIIGKGEVLIMLVCHSGSMNRNFLKNELSSLIRKFLQGDYHAVIAPFWTLHVDITKIWLSRFIQEFESNQFIIDAVHKANLKIMESYPIVSAWGCMHLYGNPFLKLENSSAKNKS